MSSLLKRILILAPLVAAASWGSRTLYVTERSPFDLTDRTPAASTADHDSRTATSRFFYDPKPGQRYQYEFAREIVLKGLPSQEGRISFHGSLALDVLKVKSGILEAVATAKISEARSEPVSLRVLLNSKTGKMELASFEKQSAEKKSADDEQQKAILKDLLAQWNFLATEDTVGPYEARFDSLHKSKVRYLESAGALPEIRASEHVLSWNAALGLPQSVEGQETTRMSSGTLNLSSESRYSIIFKSQESISADAVALASHLTASEPLLVKASPSAQQAPSWAQIQDELADLDGADHEKQLKILGDLIKAIKADSQGVDQLMALLQSSGAVALGLKSPLFNVIVGALASAGTPQAQDALVKIYSDPSCPIAAKGAILSALTTTAAPLTRSTQGFLAQTMSAEGNPDLAQGAAFAAGAAIRRAPASLESQVSAQALHDAWTGQKSSITDRLAVIDAIGNSGQTSYLPDLKSIIGDSNADVALRAQAVLALRYMASSDAAQVLMTSLTDSSARVRQAAIVAISYATSNGSDTSAVKTYQSALTQCAQRESVSSIQASCQAVLPSG